MKALFFTTAILLNCTKPPSKFDMQLVSYENEQLECIKKFNDAGPARDCINAVKAKYNLLWDGGHE